MRFEDELKQITNNSNRNKTCEFKINQRFIDEVMQACKRAASNGHSEASIIYFEEGRDDWDFPEKVSVYFTDTVHTGWDYSVRRGRRYKTEKSAMFCKAIKSELETKGLTNISFELSTITTTISKIKSNWWNTKSVFKDITEYELVVTVAWL